MQSQHRRRSTSPTSDHQPIDLPDEREYDDDADAALDTALQEAVEHAEEADHEFLAWLLQWELASFRYERGTPK